MFVKFLKWVLAFQLAFAPSFALASQTRRNGPQHFIRKLAEEGVKDRKTLEEWFKAADAVESGDLSQLPNYDNNSFQFANQRIEILEEGSFSLNDPHLELPSVSFTGLKVYYDEKDRELIFEGFQGQNERGENGKLMARHVIPDMDISTMTKDEELLQIVDSKGNLHAIDMGYVSQVVFKSLIPVFKKVWEPAVETENAEYEIHYATLGTEPPSLENLDDNVVLPLNEEGQVDIRAGDAIVYRKNGEAKELVGIFSRDTTYTNINIGFEYLYKMLLQIFPSNLSAKRLEALQEIVDHSETVAAYEAQTQTIPQVIRKAFRNISEEQVEAIFGPVNPRDVSEETGSYRSNQNRAARQFQQLDESTWVSAYEKLKAKAVLQSQELEKELDGVLNDDTREELEYQKTALDTMIADGDFSQIWKTLYTESDMNKGRDYRKAKRESRMKKLAQTLKLGALAPFLTIGAVMGVTWGFPAVYEANESMQQVQALNWMYQAFPDVVKDAGYKMPLLYSTIALLAIWPASVSFSFGIGKALKLMSASLQKSKSIVGRTIRDLSNKWSDLNNWQRITSFGMRFFGTLIYPVGRLLVGNVMRQPGIVSALSAKLNPFKKIDPDTALGRELGLEKPMRLGLSNPFSFGKSAREKRAQQLKAQSLVAERNQRVENMSWILAATLVAEQEGVDAATIEMVAKGNLDPKNLESAFKDKETRRQWVATQSRIRRYLEGVGEGYFDAEMGGIDAEQMEDFHKFALEIAQSLKGQDKSKVLLENLWANSRKALHKSTDIFFNFGLADSKFLRTVYTNKAVSHQTERGFVSDHIMVALIYALIGERADLNEPHALAADPNGALWTSGPHWADVSLNTYAHFFSAGSKRALIFQTVKPENSDNYIPEEYLWTNEVNRRENFSRSTVKWFSQVLDTRKSNLGYFALKAFYKRFNTIAAGLYMNVAVRMSMGDQTFGNAAMGFLLFIFAGQWFFGWPWDIIDRGAIGEGERVDEMKAAYAKVMAEISEALRESPERSEEKLRSALNELMELYQKFNPQALQALEALGDTDSMLELFKEFKTQVGEDSMVVMGLAAKIKLAEASGDKNASAKARDELLALLEKSGGDKQELQKLSAMALQEYALSELPVFTEAHPSISWAATFVMGAFLTTIMAIPLSVYSFDDSASAAARAAVDPSVDPNDYYLKPEILAMWAGISAVGYYSYFKLLGKDGYWSKFLDKFSEWRKSKGKNKSCDKYFK